MQTSYWQRSLATGRVEASQQAQLGFELSGTLDQTSVDEGGWVEQGQVLARLDRSRLNARMHELKASLERAKADARLAKLSESRVKDLVLKKLESPQRLDETRESTLAAAALVTEIRARIDSLKVELNKSDILAPFAGYVVERWVDKGTVVTAGPNPYSPCSNRPSWMCVLPYPPSMLVR